jgi:hypothetical protein
MEGECFTEMAATWVGNLGCAFACARMRAFLRMQTHANSPRMQMHIPVGNPLVEVMAHDEDNQLNTIVHEVGWNILEMLDRNRVVKYFDQHYKRIAFEKGSPRGRWLPHMGELGPRLKMWFYTVMKFDDEPASRRRMWLGAYEHYTTRKHKWSGWNDDDAKRLLRQFLDVSVALADKCQGKFASA